MAGDVAKQFVLAQLVGQFLVGTGLVAVFGGMAGQLLEVGNMLADGVAVAVHAAFVQGQLGAGVGGGQGQQAG